MLIRASAPEMRGKKNFSKSGMEQGEQTGNNLELQTKLKRMDSLISYLNTINCKMDILVGQVQMLFHSWEASRTYQSATYTGLQSWPLVQYFLMPHPLLVVISLENDPTSSLFIHLGWVWHCHVYWCVFCE